MLDIIKKDKINLFIFFSTIVIILIEILSLVFLPNKVYLKSYIYYYGSLGDKWKLIFLGIALQFIVILINIDRVKRESKHKRFIDIIAQGVILIAVIYMFFINLKI